MAALSFCIGARGVIGPVGGQQRLPVIGEQAGAGSELACRMQRIGIDHLHLLGEQTLPRQRQGQRGQ